MSWTRGLLALLAVCVLLVTGSVSCGADGARKNKDGQSVSPVGKVLDDTDHEGRHYREVDKDNAPDVGIVVQPDADDSWSVRLTVENFTFSPTRTREKAVSGRGVAVLFVDDRPVTTLRTPSYRLSAAYVSQGTHKVTVRLYADDGTVWAVDGAPVESTADVTASKPQPTGNGAGNGASESLSGGSGGGVSGARAAVAGDGGASGPRAAAGVDGTASDARFAMFAGGGASGSRPAGVGAGGSGSRPDVSVGGSASGVRFAVSAVSAVSSAAAAQAVVRAGAGPLDASAGRGVRGGCGGVLGSRLVVRVGGSALGTEVSGSPPLVSAGGNALDVRFAASVRGGSSAARLVWGGCGGVLGSGSGSRLVVRVGPSASDVQVGTGTGVEEGASASRLAFAARAVSAVEVPVSVGGGR
ncbi:MULTISPECIES: hypothetical protein [Streptomyces]|uniref:hypothetical protein n=1 Tax=Streptomyces TaxID=1883 RepID=UPI00298D753B|nr:MULTISPECIES: hypothetical protein [Streptomyces]